MFILKKVLVIPLTFEYICPDVVEEQTHILGNDYVSEVQSLSILIICLAGLLD